jgi:hypothetical protein
MPAVVCVNEARAGDSMSAFGPSLHLMQYKRMSAFGGRAEVARIP